MVEAVEPRVLLSVAAAVTPPFDPAADGYTPAQVRKAYGIDQVTFANGTIPGDGRGQTIAIVDAQDNPMMRDDLTTFDTQFGLPAPPSFQIVNQRGGTTLPAPDPGWAGEITLDVEWAHAIAPMANILLVETDTQDFPNLAAGVDYARQQPGVSVVSMSWGGNEFFQWSLGDINSQNLFDSVFWTPVGHQGVTFIAAAGDHTAQAGVLWPAASPNVLTIGGTSLHLADTTGTYGSEQYWTGTNSGYSNVETEPPYQRGIQGVGFRSVPDVSYNADPNTGIAVFSNFAFGGWLPGGIGGTSEGSPQWAALIAIANQGRVANGLGTLDGPSQTLPILYSLYSPPFSSGFSHYSNDFYDVTLPADSPTIQWRFGGVGFNDQIPTIGFDTATGLGSPKAPGLLQDLSTLSAPTRLPITGTFVTSPKANVVGADFGMVKLRVTNTADVPFSGPLDLTLYASPNGTLTYGNTAFSSMRIDDVKLKPHKSKNVEFRFNYPGNLPSGSYQVLSLIQDPASNTIGTTAASNAFTLAPPSGDLAASFVGKPVVVKPGHPSSAVLRIKNVGNQLAQGNVSLILYASADQTLDPTVDQGLLGLPPRKVNLKPGHSMTIRIPFIAPIDKAAGSYFLIASITPSVQPADSNAANNMAVIATRATGRAARALARGRIKWHLV